MPTHAGRCAHNAYICVWDLEIRSALPGENERRITSDSLAGLKTDAKRYGQYSIPTDYEKNLNVC
jgi:hypothetical protein